MRLWVPVLDLYSVKGGRLGLIGKVNRKIQNQQHFDNASSRNSSCAPQLDHVISRLCFCWSKLKGCSSSALRI